MNEVEVKVKVSLRACLFTPKTSEITPAVQPKTLQLNTLDVVLESLEESLRDVTSTTRIDFELTTLEVAF